MVLGAAAEGGLTAPVHALVAGSGQARVAVVGAIVERFFDGLDEVPLLEEVGLYEDSVADDPVHDGDAGPVDPVAAAAQYEKWCALVDRREPGTGSGTASGPCGTPSGRVRRAGPC